MKISVEDVLFLVLFSRKCAVIRTHRRFWNQILTWVSVSLSWLENSARSEMERYCFSRNFFSSEFSCWVVKGVRGLRVGLCFRRVHFSGPGGGLNRRSTTKIVLLKASLNSFCHLFQSERPYNSYKLHRIVLK